MKLSIGFFSQTKVFGGSEVYLRTILDHLDHTRYDGLLFCNSQHPLLTDRRIRSLIEEGSLRIVNTRWDAPVQDAVSSTVPVARRHVPFKTRVKTRVLRIIPRSIKLFLGTVKEIPNLVKLFRDHPVDILHFNDTGCEPAVIAARLAKVPHILGTYHVLPSDENKASTWTHRLIEWLSVRSMHVGIAASEATKQAWITRTRIFSTRIKVIYNGIDLSSFGETQDSLAIKNDLSIPLEKQIIGVLARLHPMKGHQYLLQAISLAKSDLRNTVFLLIGDGELRASLQASVEQLGIQEIVRFLGHRSDIPRLMSILDLVVLSSVALEALPFALIEAQASTKAVVASNFSGIPEIIADGVTGILVPPRDSAALAAAILKLLRNSQLRQSMGERGRERTEKLFSVDRMLTQTFQLYEDMLNGTA